MKFSVQFVNRLGDEQTYSVIAALVLDETTQRFTPVSFTSPAGDLWATDAVGDLARWKEGPHDLQSRLVDQNGTRTAYSWPVDVEAESADEAAQRAYINR